MIWFRIAGWVTGSLEAQHADGFDDTQVLVDGEASALDVANIIRDWFLDGARPWATSISGCVVSVVPVATRLSIVLTFSGSDPLFTYLYLDGEVAGGLGEPALVANTIVFAPPILGGDFACDLGTLNWSRHDTSTGTRCRRGSWRMEHPALALRRPSIVAVLDAAETFALGQALEAAADPRVADIYDEGARTWRRCKVGEVSLETDEEDWTWTHLRVQAVEEA